VKIVQVGTGFVPVLPGGAGGVERYTHYLATGLAMLGHEVSVIDMRVASRPASKYRVVEIPLHWRYDRNLVSHAVRGLLFGRVAEHTLARLIRYEGVDVVNFQSQFTGVTGIRAAQRFGVPTVFTMHNPLWSDALACQSTLERAKFWLEHKSEVKADGVVGLSRAVTENRVRFFGLPPAKVAVAPVGVDEYWFEQNSPGTDVRRKYAPDGQLVVLHVGRIAPYKNQLTLLKAAARLFATVPRARLVLVGPTESQRYFRELQRVAAANAGGRIVFAGVIPFEELSQLYGLAQVIVLPSLRENCPQVLLEAMAQGKAIVTSDIPPLTEILPPGTGITLPALDQDALADALLNLLRRERFRETMGAQARQRAREKYRWTVVTKQVAYVYDRVLRGVALNGLDMLTAV